MASFAEKYDAFILDIWGVLMDGLQPYPGATNCLEKLRANNKKIVLLSNAPRQSHIVAEKLNSIGIAATLYDHILSSGEATRLTLSKHPDLVLEGLGTTYFYIGPDRDRGFLDGLNYSVSNDLTARTMQHKHKQWFIGKSLDGYCPMGPVLLTKDEAGHPDTFHLKTEVNGEVRQNASCSTLIFDIPTLIEVISAGITLLPGDIIITGTPVGVGIGFEPPVFLQKGDKVNVTIDPIGTIQNIVE